MIDKVISKITGKELKSFVRIYSYTHGDFATALVEEYWKPERGNYMEMVKTASTERKRMTDQEFSISG